MAPKSKPATDAWRPDRGRLAAASLVVLVLSGLFFFWYHDYGLAPFDEGILLEGVRLEQEGRMEPAKFSHYSIQYRLLAWLSPEGGPDLEVARMVWVVFRAVTAALILLIAGRLMSLRWAVLPVVLFLAVPGPWHKAPVAFGVCLCLHALLRAIENGRRRDAVWFGVSIAMAFSFHPYTGVFTGLAWCALVFADPAVRFGGLTAERTPRRFFDWNATVVLSGAIGTAVFAPYLLRISPFDFFGQNAGLAKSIMPGSGLFAAQLTGFATDPETTLTVVTYLIVLTVLAGTVWVTLVGRRRESSPLTRSVLLCAAVICLANLPKWLVRLDLAHMLQNAVPAWVLSAYILSRFVAPGSRRLVTRSIAALLGLWFATMIVYGIISPRTFVGGVGTRLAIETVPLPHPHGTIHVDPSVADALTTLTELVWSNSAEGDTILIRAYPKIVHYLSGRPSPVVAPVFAFPAVFAASPIDELVAEIRTADTAVVIYDPVSIVPIDAYRLENLAPELHRLIMDEYRVVGKVGTIEVRVAKSTRGESVEPRLGSNTAPIPAAQRP